MARPSGALSHRQVCVNTKRDKGVQKEDKASTCRTGRINKERSPPVMSVDAGLGFTATSFANPPTGTGIACV